MDPFSEVMYVTPNIPIGSLLIRLILVIWQLRDVIVCQLNVQNKGLVRLADLMCFYPIFKVKMGVQCLLPDCGHCSDHDKCKYYRIPKDLFEYYKWKHFLESVVNINEQLCSLLKLSQIMLLSFLCQSCTLFSLVL